MSNETQARRSAVETLQQFYAVIVAFALTAGVEKFVSSIEQISTTNETVIVIALGIAFVSTIVPFFHGMNRHLYEVHIARAKKAVGRRPIPLLFDIFVFLVEGGLLFAMGRALQNPEVFLWLWTSLLTVDIVWSTIVWRYQRSERPIWAVINLVSCTAVWIFWLALSPTVMSLLNWEIPWVLQLKVIIVAAAELSRSITDYAVNWKYYFPDSDGESAV